MPKISNDIKLIFAIGNPESEYENTRHNVGIFFIKQILKELNLDYTYKKKLSAYVSHCTDLLENKIHLAISNVYMNNSGECLSQIMNYYKLEPKEILVIQDEMSKNLAEISVKFNGSSHGHNGIKNIIQKINTNKFYKLKIGIGKPQQKFENVKYVLSTFDEYEIKLLKEKIYYIILKIQKNGLLKTIESLEI